MPAPDVNARMLALVLGLGEVPSCAPLESWVVSRAVLSLSLSLSPRDVGDAFRTEKTVRGVFGWRVYGGDKLAVGGGIPIENALIYSGCVG
mmetsp:Transcript_12787/g.25277  ORF Transcript_12787/g.25277 Transcript_12787/m.25277 type:complete len:91 (-) Transcript_12787:477-749(-)|eukprot:CAMPEP_0173397026 /NCGR_PEP_ID=MMETSP1356-20130122/37192_1 /TAXON_ID=77927 ORGANISM="Hemiselmis virescens, Strain PCC157" /NCGR_SAMPLE_ID=MMETSP1356 /ASSEMBLY_ACC=CAM_ASM_000847 /LENGTH=90 /DNA_ID=CAMNT_0014356189 /DNA_START=297 /DNA_END=572 /DNA_ORIENTATION=-